MPNNLDNGFQGDSGKNVKVKRSFIRSINETINQHQSFNDGDMNRFLKTAGIILLSLLSIFVIVKTISEVKAYTTIGEQPMTPYMITVSGKGEVAAVKNIAVLSFSSSAKGTTATEAQSTAAEANNKAIAFLKSKGVDVKDISTQGYYTNPTYDQKVKPCIVETSKTISEPATMSVTNPSTAVAPTKLVAPIAPCNSYESVITGYETTQTVQVKIRGIDTNPNLTGEIITGLGEAGVRVGGLDNQVDKPEMLKAQARAIAIADARTQADQIAQSLGVKITKVVSFSENDYGYPRPANAMYGGTMMDKAAVSPEIPVGEGEISSTVSVTYEIR